MLLIRWWRSILSIIWIFVWFIIFHELVLFVLFLGVVIFSLTILRFLLYNVWQIILTILTRRSINRLLLIIVLIRIIVRWHHLGRVLLVIVRLVLLLRTLMMLMIHILLWHLILIICSISIFLIHGILIMFHRWFILGLSSHQRVIWLTPHKFIGLSPY